MANPGAGVGVAGPALPCVIHYVMDRAGQGYSIMVSSNHGAA